MCKKFAEFWDLYNQSFPSEERRDLTAQKQILQDFRYDLECYYDEAKLKGFCAVWIFDDFIFIDHIAISPEFRGQGIGSEIMNKVINNHKKPIILEVEKPETETAQRRITFYERLGFKLNEFDYYQPSLGPGKPSIPLHLMSHPNLIKSKHYEQIKASIYQTVYQTA